jgi:pimeloyl-ACP methyl ester carboxylesterase
MARAHDIVTAWGFRVVAIDAPGHGDRIRTAEDEQARADLHEAMTAGDAGRVASVSARYGGGITLGTAIGIPLTAIEPRITAAIFGGGFVVHPALVAAARRVTVPVQFLLPWDDEHALSGCSTPSPRRRRRCTPVRATIAACAGPGSTTSSWSVISARPGRPGPHRHLQLGPAARRRL